LSPYTRVAYWYPPPSPTRRSSDLVNVAHVRVMVLDVGDPLFVWGRFLILPRHRLGALLALIIFELARPRGAVHLEGNGFADVREIDGVERKLGGRDFAL